MHCSSSPDWRLKPFTHGEQTSTHCLNFKTFAIIFSTIITYKAFILCKFQTFNQRHLTFSIPLIPLSSDEITRLRTQLLLTLQKNFGISSNYYNIWVDNWQDFKQCQQNNFICCRECSKYLLHPTVCSSSERNIFVPYHLLFCITTYAALLEMPAITPAAVPTAVSTWHTHCQKLCVLNTSCTCKPKIMSVLPILSQVCRYVTQPLVWVVCMNFQRNKSINNSIKLKSIIFKITKLNRKLIPKAWLLYLSQMNH